MLEKKGGHDQNKRGEKKKRGKNRAKLLQSALTTIHEILLILIRMKPDLVTRKNTFDQLLAHRECPPEIRCGKRRMQRESNSALFPLLVEPFPQHSRHKHEVVVVHPDQIPRGRGVGHSHGEDLVDFDV